MFDSFSRLALCIVCHSTRLGTLLGCARDFEAFTSLNKPFGPHEFQEEVVIRLKVVDDLSMVDVHLSLLGR